MAASEGVEFRRKRFVHRTLSLDDVKFVKNAMKCVRASLSFCCSYYSSRDLLL